METHAIWYLLLACFVGLSVTLVPERRDPFDDPSDHVSRVDCQPEGVADKTKCLERGCIYGEVYHEPGVPWCYFPHQYGYSLDGAPIETDQGLLINLVRNPDIGSFVGGDYEKLTLEAQFQTNERLRIKITPTNVSRFEVPIKILGNAQRPANPLYDVKFLQDVSGFHLRVIRRSSGTIIFDTSLPGLIFSEQFIQLPAILPSRNIYGLGENEQHSYRHNVNWKTWTAYARDQPPSHYANMYGTHPTYTVLENDGKTHSVLFLNSAAQEWSLTPKPALIYKTIGGILDIYFFLGPEPEDSARQYTEAIGRYPLPPYWSLGFHLCRYGYNNLENLQAAVNRTAQYDIPHDAQWGDIDIMDRQLDFTVSKERFAGLSSYVEELKSQGIKFVTIQDPCISTGEGQTYRPYQLGNKMDVWVKKLDGSNALGKVWPDDPTYFADFSSPSAKEWWSILIREFHSDLAFDALWIDMNEPANFIAGDLIDNGCANTSTNYPPYKPRTAGQTMSDKTLCGDAQHHLGSHYDTHNLYGWTQSEPTLKGVRNATGQRGWVLSRSTFVGSGNWVAHWLGDNFSNWENLRYSIIGMLQFNRFGIPHVGADICGFISDTNEELCARWHQLGAFYPFSRNHNGLGYREQDPGSFGPVVAEVTRSALHYRYRFLPYLYTLFFKHFTEGALVARALWEEFPRDAETWNIDQQFMWGPGLLISPVLEEGGISKRAYFPHARWYDITHWIKNGTIEELQRVGEHKILPATLYVLPLHVRGGHIFPMQPEARNTDLARSNPWQLLVALDEQGQASGELFMDDGVSEGTVEREQYYQAAFSHTNGTLTSSILSHNYDSMSHESIDEINIVGIEAEDIVRVTVNGQQAMEFQFNEGRLTIANLKLPMSRSLTLAYE